MTPRTAAVSLLSRVVAGHSRFLVVWNRKRHGWSLPGGLVEDGETLEAAQARELEEETGLITTSRELLFHGPHHLPEEPGRATHVALFRVVTAGTPLAVEDGCPISWRSASAFLSQSPYRAFYRRVFAELGIG